MEVGLIAAPTTNQPTRGWPPIVFSDGFLGDNYFKEEGEIDKYDEAFEDIAKRTLNLAESRTFIEEAAEGLARNG